MDRPAPLHPDQWPPELDEISRKLGNPLNIHRLMAHNPSLTQAWMPYRNHIVADSSLAPRHRELLILRTAVNCAADYEWEHHVVRGRAAGLSDAEIQRVKAGPEADAWQPEEALLLRAADECRRDSGISDRTYASLNRYFNLEQQLDIIATVGMYLTLATIIKTYRLQLEDR
jgi:4-carboxymuconolactone decarboxylase